MFLALLLLRDAKLVPLSAFFIHCINSFLNLFGMGIALRACARTIQRKGSVLIFVKSLWCKSLSINPQ